MKTKAPKGKQRGRKGGAKARKTPARESTSRKNSTPPPAELDHSAIGKRSRTKGKAFELLAVHELQEIYGPNVKRGIGQARAANEVPDIDGTPWWVEAKHRQRPNIPAALAQAMKDSGGRRPALAITRANNAPIMVSMFLEDFRRLVLTPDLKPLWCDDCGLAPLPPSYCVHGVCRVGRELT